MRDFINAMTRRIFRRRQAYRALFQPGGQLSTAANIVLTDLRGFCRATVSTTVVSPSTGSVDPIASAQAEGRREVWLRITQHLHISDEDLYGLVERRDDETT
jgi:hypothetical protein